MTLDEVRAELMQRWANAGNNADELRRQRRRSPAARQQVRADAFAEVLALLARVAA